MEEDYIDQLYTHLGGDKSGIDKNAFRKDMSTNKEYNKQIFDYMKGESQGISYDAFLKDTFTPVKKKGATRPTLGSTPSGGSLESPKKSEVPINKKQQEQFLSQSNTLGDSLKGIESTVPKIADSTVVKDIQSKNLTIPDAQKQQQKERIEQEKGFMQSLIDTPIEALTSGVLNMVGGVSGLIGGVADVLIDKNPDAKYPIFSDKWIGRKIQQGGELENPSFGTNQWFRDTFMGASSTLSKVAGLESQDARKSIGVSDTSKSTIDHLLSGNIKDTGKSLVVDVIEQLPNIVLMASTGGSSGSLGVVGASSAGANLQEQYSQDQDISMTDLSQGIVMGITEVVTEKVFDLDVKGLSKIGGKLSDFLGSSGKDLKEKIAREGVEKVRNEIVRSTSDVLKQGAKGVKEEVLEENIVTVVDYFVKAIDEDVFNQEGFSQLLKDMGQSTLVAAASGGGISTIAAKASQVKFTKQESRKIEQYKEILANKNISLGTKNIAKNRIEEINAGVETATSERYDKIVALPIEDRIDILDKQAKIQTLEADKVATMDVEINSAIDERITELNAEIDAKINPKVEPALPSEISGFLTERNNETLSSVEQRIDNAELINENDIAGATSPLYDAIDGISKDKSLSEGDKQAAISLIEDKITKLESYEFETETKIIQPEQERPVLVSKQIIGKVTRGSKNPSEVTKGRFDGKQASVNETDGVIVYDEKADVLSVVHDDGRTDLDFNYLEYQESSLDEDGNLQSVKLVDKRNGDEVSINDQDLAYDIAIKAKTQQLGEIQDAVFDEVYETVKQEAITKEVVKEKPTIPLVNNNQGGSNQPPTPPVVPPGKTNKGANQNEWERSKQMMVDQENLLAEMGKKKPFIQRFIKNWFERQQGIIKALGKGASADKVRTMMTTVAGARSYADEQFKRKEKGIFGKKSIEQEKTLDLHLFNRRVIEIDSNYDKNNQERIKHPEDVNKERALQAISELKQEIGDKAFDKLNKDADKYFEAMNEILGRMYEDGLISEAVYDKLKGDDYIQRVFIDHINDTADGRTKTLEDYGLKANQIKALSEGSTGLLLLDSRALLSAAYRSVEQRVFQNNANKALAEFVSKTNNNKLGKEMKPKYKKDGTKEYGAADKGYTKIIHFKNGEIFATQLKKEYAAEWLDLEKTTTELDNRLRVLMGTALLKQMATGINATFAISNIPADYLNIIMFTDTFDNTNVFNAMVKLGLNFTTNFAELVALKSIGIGRPKFKELSDSFTKYGGGMEFLTTYGKPDELITRDKGIVKQVAGKVSNTAVNTLAFTGEQSERAMRLAVFDEVRTQLIKQNGGKSKLSPEKWDEINYTAAARARETMDFAKGGLLAKKADVVSPYFNAGAQGTRVAAEYVYKNPKKFASKWTQISGAAASLMLYNMMVGDEEDWANLSDKEKNSYFVVFNPFKKEGGKRGYYRIKKTPALAPFLVFAEAGAMAMYNQFTGKNWGGGDSVLHREWETVNDALPIPLDPRNLPNKLPPVPRSVLSYFANYDFYRKQKLVNGQEEDISSQYQGVTDEKIPDFYKKIGQVSANVTGGEGLSPKKLQKTTEMIITSPNTNPIVGGAYHFLDKLVNTFGDVPETWNSKDKEISQIFGGAKARVYREIDPEYGRYQDQSLKILQKDLASTKYLLRNEVSSSVENGATEKEIKSLIGSKELSDGEKTSLFNYAKSVKDRAYLAKTIPDYYKLAPVKYWRGSPEDKVKLFVNNMGLIDPKSEEFSSILKDMKRMEISTSPRFRDEYYKLYNNATQNKNK
jgi:hypothetical protein